MREIQCDGTSQVAVKTLGWNSNGTFPDGIPSVIATWISAETRETITTHRITIPKDTAQQQVAAAELQWMSVDSRNRFDMTTNYKLVYKGGVSKITKLKKKAKYARDRAKHEQVSVNKLRMQYDNAADAKKRDELMKIMTNRSLACKTFNKKAKSLCNKAKAESRVTKTNIVKLKQKDKQIKEQSP